MKVKCLTDAYPASLVQGKIYDVINIEQGWYRIIDEDGVDDDDDIPGYLYPPNLFEIVEED